MHKSIGFCFTLQKDFYKFFFFFSALSFKSLPVRLHDVEAMTKYSHEFDEFMIIDIRKETMIQLNTF